MAHYGDYNPCSFDNYEIRPEDATNFIDSPQFSTQPSPQFYTQPAPSASSQPSKYKSKKKKQKKPSDVSNTCDRKLWTEHEDERLCKSWCNISNDRVVGNEISRKGFWANVHHEYHKELPAGWICSRSEEKLRQHFAEVGCRVKKFQTKFLAELRRNQSGKNEKYMYHAAELAYYEDEKKTFKDHLAFEVLKDQPKWHTKEFKPKSIKKQKTSMSESVSTNFDVPLDIEEEEVSKLERPKGRKAAKAAAFQTSSSSTSSFMDYLNQFKIDEAAKNEISIKKLSIIAEGVETKGHVKLMKERRKIMSMNAYAPTNTPEQTDWILQMQKKVYEKMKNEEI